MTYPQVAADLARTLSDLTLTRAGAHLTSSSSPRDDEVALHAGLRARQEVLSLVRTIVEDVAPFTETNNVRLAAMKYPNQPTPMRSKSLDSATGDERLRWDPETMLLGRWPQVAVLAVAVEAYPDVPLRFSDSDPAEVGDGRAAPWVQAGQQALVAQAQYLRAGGASDYPTRWSALSDAASLAQLLTHLDTDLSRSLAAHPLAEPGATAALRQARDVGPDLAHAAATVQLRDARRTPVDYATAPRAPHEVVRVDSPWSLVRAQQRLPSLIADSATVAPATLARIINTQERLAIDTGSRLRETDPTRAALGRATARTLRKAMPYRASLTDELATLTRDDPAPDLQNREIARYLRQLDQVLVDTNPALGGALDATSGVLNAVIASARASTRAGAWLTSAPVIPARGALGDYPWQRADLVNTAPLLERLSLAAGHQATYAASPRGRGPSRQKSPSPSAHTLLGEALARRPPPLRSQGSQLER